MDWPISCSWEYSRTSSARWLMNRIRCSWSVTMMRVSGCSDSSVLSTFRETTAGSSVCVTRLSTKEMKFKRFLLSCIISVTSACARKSSREISAMDSFSESKYSLKIFCLIPRKPLFPARQTSLCIRPPRILPGSGFHRLDSKYSQFALITAFAVWVRHRW